MSRLDPETEEALALCTEPHLDCGIDRFAPR